MDALVPVCLVSGFTWILMSKSQSVVTDSQPVSPKPTKRKHLTVIQDGSKYAHNVGAYYRFGEVLDDNLSIVVVEREKHPIDDQWLLKARNGSTGHLTPDKLKIVSPEGRDELIASYLGEGIFVGVLENVVEDGTTKGLWDSPVKLHSKEFSDIVAENDEMVFIVGHESSGVSDEVRTNKNLCPLTIETRGTSKKDSSLGVQTVVCTLLNQVRNYTINPVKF
jgi:tRNA G18 (ribose-2'-O)-methylase SpoU